MDELDARLRAMAKAGRTGPCPQPMSRLWTGWRNRSARGHPGPARKTAAGEAGAVPGGGAGSTGLWFCRGGGAHGLAEPSGG